MQENLIFVYLMDFVNVQIKSNKCMQKHKEQRFYL